MTYSTSSDHPIAVVGVQIAEAIDNANDVNAANKDPDSVFISGNSRPCLIDILMFGTLRQMKELNSLSCFASPTTTTWFNTVDEIIELLQIRRRLQYCSVCCETDLSFPDHGFGVFDKETVEPVECEGRARRGVLTGQNREKVWLREQEVEKEKKKIAELQKQIQQSRQRMELRKLQNGEDDKEFEVWAVFSAIPM